MQSEIIQHIDTEIHKLQSARELLLGQAPVEQVQELPVPAIHLMPHRKMSDEVRAKMSASAKLRWKKRRNGEKSAAKAA